MIKASWKINLNISSCEHWGEKLASRSGETSPTRPFQGWGSSCCHRAHIPYTYIKGFNWKTIEPSIRKRESKSIFSKFEQLSEIKMKEPSRKNILKRHRAISMVDDLPLLHHRAILLPHRSAVYFLPLKRPTMGEDTILGGTRDENTLFSSFNGQSPWDERSPGDQSIHHMKKENEWM